MTRKFYLWLVAVVVTGASSYSLAQDDAAQEKLVGKWDSNAGIISIFVRESDEGKRARMLVVDEHVEGALSRLSVELSKDDLDDLEDLLEQTVEELGDVEKLTVRPVGSRDVVKQIGKLIYPNGNITFEVVDPAGTQRYASVYLRGVDSRYQYVFWLDKPDLLSLEKLLEKSLKAMGIAAKPAS